MSRPEPAPPRHGRLLTAAHVGPRILNGEVLPATAGFVIRDGHVAAPCRRIDGDALYDGHRVAGPHLLLERTHIVGSLDIYARQPVVVRDMRLLAGPGHWGIHVRPGAGPVLVLHCALSGVADAHAGAGLFVRGEGVTAHRCHIRRFTDGVLASAGQLIVSECLIGDITHVLDDHNDGIQLEGAPRSVTIARCHITNHHPQTSAVKLKGQGIVIEDCYLAGGGWTLHAGARYGAQDVTVTGTVFARDVFAKVGHFGVVTDWSRDPARRFRWHVNVRDDGRPLRP